MLRGIPACSIRRAALRHKSWGLVAFAMYRLQATEGRDLMIPVAELAERLSKIHGRPIDRKQMLSLAWDEPDDRATLEAIARMLEVELEWLQGDTAVR